MQQIRGGASDALAVLFDRHWRQVYSVADRILRDRAGAEDVTQEVLLAVFQDAGKFDPAAGSVKRWILQCASQRSLNRCQDLTLSGRSDEREVA